MGNNSLSDLPAGVFDGLTALDTLLLQSNSLSNLPAGVFSGLTSLETLRLDGNPVSPLPVAVSLEPSGPGRFRAVAPTAAPFALTLPVSVVNGEIDGAATTLTIPTGMVHSDSVSVTRIGGFAVSVTADIGTLPGLPSGHRGYALEKSSGLPLEVFAAASFCDRTEQVRDAIVAAVPGVSACANVTAAHLAAITSLDLGSAGITSLQAGDFSGLTALTYLDLHSNSLSDLPAGVFDALTALQALDLGSNSLSNLPAVVFDGLTALETLDLGNNSLRNLPASVFDALTALEHRSVHNQPVHFSQTLYLGNNSLSDLPASVFDALTALQTLNLNGNSSLSDLPASVFDALTALETLYLGNNSLSNLPAGVFDGLTALETLSLGNNSLSDLPAGVFDGLTALETLLLQSNSLSSLPAGVFSGLTSLESLRLDGNPGSPLPVAVSLEPAEPGRFRAVAPTAAPFALTLPVSVVYGEIDGGATTLTIPTGMVHSDSVSVTRIGGFAVTADIGTLPGLPSGHRGYALEKSSGLPLEVFAAAPFCDRTEQVRDAIVAAVPGVSACANVTTAHLAAITSLDLGSAGITSLQAGDFDGLTALTSLDLRSNSLSNLPAVVFDGLTALESLYLGSNSLSDLPASVFDALTALESLSLGDNSLGNLPASVFDALTALETLNLNSNSLSNLQAGVFDALTALETLYLGNNSLSNLPAGVFDGLTALETLSLGYNSLSDLPAGVFSGLTALTELSLNNNSLSSLPAGVFSGLTSLESLRLDGNPVSPLPVAVSLEPAEPGRFRAVAPTAAPFALTLPVSVVNGEIDGGATTLTIPAGMVHSDSVSVTRIGVFAVTADIGTLPGLPSGHRGYALEKSSGLPLEVFAANAAPSTCTLNTGDLWCGVVTVGELGDGDGFLNTIGGLSDTEFDYGTTRYTITSVHVSDSMALGFNLNAALTDAARDKLVLRVGATSFAFSDATYFPGSKSYLWSSTGLDWSSETLVTLHLWSPDNNAPLFAETMATRTVPENSPAGTDVGAAVTATDADSGDTLTYSLEGTDAGSFTIVETSGQIRTVTGVTYDHEAPQNSYSVTVKADDSADGTDTIAVTINVTDDDTEAPDTPDAPYVSAASATSLNVTWSAPDNAGPAITDYDYRYFERMRLAGGRVVGGGRHDDHGVERDDRGPAGWTRTTSCRCGRRTTRARAAGPLRAAAGRTRTPRPRSPRRRRSTRRRTRRRWARWRQRTMTRTTASRATRSAAARMRGSSRSSFDLRRAAGGGADVRRCAELRGRAGPGRRQHLQVGGAGDQRRGGPGADGDPGDHGDGDRRRPRGAGRAGCAVGVGRLGDEPERDLAGAGQRGPGHHGLRLPLPDELAAGRVGGGGGHDDHGSVGDDREPAGEHVLRRAGAGDERRGHGRLVGRLDGEHQRPADAERRGCLGGRGRKRDLHGDAVGSGQGELDGDLDGID